MIREWREMDDRSVMNDGEGAESLIAFLVRSGDKGAIESLCGCLGSKSVMIRMRVISAMRSVWNSLSWVAGEENPEDVRARVRSVLFDALQDREVTGMNFGFRGGKIENARICDLAAQELWEQCPFKFPFDIGEPLHARDAAIVGIVAGVRARDEIG